MKPGRTPFRLAHAKIQTAIARGRGTVRPARPASHPVSAGLPDVLGLPPVRLCGLASGRLGSLLASHEMSAATRVSVSGARACLPTRRGEGPLSMPPRSRSPDTQQGIEDLNAQEGPLASPSSDCCSPDGSGETSRRFPRSLAINEMSHVDPLSLPAVLTLLRPALPVCLPIVCPRELASRSTDPRLWLAATRTHLAQRSGPRRA